jgi:hypothetical protein
MLPMLLILNVYNSYALICPLHSPMIFTITFKHLALFIWIGLFIKV